MKQYHELLKEILVDGEVYFEPRTKMHTMGISGSQKTYDLREDFPLMTTKDVPIRLVAEELFWKLRGDRSVKPLFDANVHIWDGNGFDQYLKVNGLKDEFPKHTSEWAAEYGSWKEKLANGEVDGDLGPVYGFQWRHWPTRDGGEVDQLENLIRNIPQQPGSRYHILDAYNVGDISDMALAPCPFHDQFTAYGDQLDLTATQRSCDTFLGVPFNIAQEALLLKMVAKETGLEARKLIHTTNNTHLYLGVPPRADFWNIPENVGEFKKRVGEVTKRADFKEVRDWYLSQVSEEGELHEGKDHMPDVLTQLAKRPRERPIVELEDVPLLEAIERPAEEIINVSGYRPHKWDTTAVMAV